MSEPEFERRATWCSDHEILPRPGASLDEDTGLLQRALIPEKPLSAESERKDLKDSAKHLGLRRQEG